MVLFQCFFRFNIRPHEIPWLCWLVSRPPPTIDSYGHHPNAVATMLENKTKIMSRQESSQLLLLQLQQLGLAFSYFFKALLLALLLLWKPSTFGTKKKKIDFALFLKQKFSRNLFCKKNRKKTLRENIRGRKRCVDGSGQFASKLILKRRIKTCV